MKQKILELSDPYQLAFIVCETPDLEQDISYRVQNNFTIALIPATPEVYKAISSLNAGGQVNAFQFIQTIKRIRGQMIQKKNEMRGNVKNERNYNYNR